jgi:hypothetical protein
MEINIQYPSISYQGVCGGLCWWSVWVVVGGRWSSDDGLPFGRYCL